MSKKKNKEQKIIKKRPLSTTEVPAPAPGKEINAGFRLPFTDYRFSNEPVTVKVLLYLISIAAILLALLIVKDSLISLLSNLTIVTGLSKLVKSIMGKDG